VSNYKNIPEISLVEKQISSKKFLPIYFLAGEDSFAINRTAEKIKEAVLPFIGSEFDVESYSMDKNEEIAPVLDSASAFPFGGEKKFILVKNFEVVKDKKALSTYAKSPSPSTVLVITYHQRIKNFNSSPFVELLERNYLFQTPILKEFQVVDWLIHQASEMGLEMGKEEAIALVEMMGDDKTLLEIQLQKFRDYLDGKGSVTFGVIEKLSFNAKGFSVFDLTNALGRGEKKRAVEILFNLLDNGNDMVYITTMLAKYIRTIAMATELRKAQIPPDSAAKKMGVSPYYYKKLSEGKFFFNEARLKKAAKALLRAELNIKTSNMDAKSIGLLLISEFFG